MLSRKTSLPFVTVLLFSLFTAYTVAATTISDREIDHSISASTISDTATDPATKIENPLTDILVDITEGRRVVLLPVGKKAMLGEVINKINDVRDQLIQDAGNYAPTPEIEVIARTLVAHYQRFREFDKDAENTSTEDLMNLSGLIDTLGLNLSAILMRYKMQSQFIEVNEELHPANSELGPNTDLEKRFLDTEGELRRRYDVREAFSTKAKYIARNLEEERKRRQISIADLDRILREYASSSTIEGVYIPETAVMFDPKSGQYRPNTNVSKEDVDASQVITLVQLFRESPDIVKEDNETRKLQEDAILAYASLLSNSADKKEAELAQTLTKLIESDREMAAQEALLTDLATEIAHRHTMLGQNINEEVFHRADSILSMAGGWPQIQRLGQRKAAELQAMTDHMRRSIQVAEESASTPVKYDIPAYDYQSVPGSYPQPNRELASSKKVAGAN